MSTLIVLQARMGSTRLPGKIFKEVDRIPLLEYEIERLHRVEGVDQLIVATSTEVQDDVVENFCHKHRIICFRGSEQDVLDRYYQAAKAFGGKTVIRISGDCPLIDPGIVMHVLNKFRSGEFDYCSNTLTRTYPRGMDTEVVSFEALEKAWIASHDLSEREHVTYYIWRNPELFKLGNVSQELDESDYRFTVDTAEDFKLIAHILHALYQTNPHFTKDDVIELLKNHPDWLKINAHVRQKAV